MTVYNRGIEPTFLNLFKTNNDIIKLDKIRLLIKRVKMTNYLPIPMGFGIVIWPYMFNESLLDIFLFGLPNAILLGIWAYYLFTILSCQFLYFYMICKYFRKRLKHLNHILIAINVRKPKVRIATILKSFNALYRKIDEYNTTYWSKFVFIIWIYLGSGLTLAIFMMIFRQLPFIMKYSIVYGVFSVTISFLFIIFCASSVNKEENVAYKALNTYYYKLTRTNKCRGATLIKVKIIEFIFFQFNSLFMKNFRSRETLNL